MGEFFIAFNPGRIDGNSENVYGWIYEREVIRHSKYLMFYNCIDYLMAHSNIGACLATNGEDPVSCLPAVAKEPTIKVEMLYTVFRNL